jgi:hypothetical protein
MARQEINLCLSGVFLMNGGFDGRFLLLSFYELGIFRAQIKRVRTVEK